MEEELEFVPDAAQGCLKGEADFHTLCFMVHFHQRAAALPQRFRKLPEQVFTAPLGFRTLIHSFINALMGAFH